MEPPKVEKFSTANRGNGLRALAQLRPGELLFRSDPLAYTVCKGSRGVVCDRCLLGYVRSAVAHPSRAPRGRGVGDVVGPPAAGLLPAVGAHVWERCPGAQPRAPWDARFPGVRLGWQGAGCRALGASQAQPPPVRGAELDPLALLPVPPGCRRNWREPVGHS